MASQVKPPETEEEEELQLALAISRSKAECNERQREQLQKMYGNQAPTDSAMHPVMLSGMDATDMDPELARYLNRNYWEKKSESGGLAPSAPQVAGPSTSVGKSAEREQQGQNTEQAQADKAQFMAALQSSLEIFVNRMRSNSQRGRPIANDSSVQSLFSVISSMHPQLMIYQQEIEDRRAYFEGLQDKLSQLRDAREALDCLRDEHREKRRRELEDLERQRQIQMMQKLEVMRQKKQEYLEMQRQQALQRLQEQEREMARRLESQKQLTQMRQMQAYGGYTQVYGQQPPMTTNPAGGSVMMGGPPGAMMPPPQQGLPQGVPPNMMPAGYMPGGVPGVPTPQDGSSAPQMAGYGAPPLPQQGPPGQEGSSGGTPGPVQGQQSQNPAMFMQPGVGQGPYSQGPQMSSSSNLNPAMGGGGVPSGYQPPGQIHPQAQMQLDGGAYSLPPPGSMGYTSMPPTMDYSSFNMHSLASTLPQHDPQVTGGVYTGPPPSNNPATALSQQPAPQAPGQPYSGGGAQYPTLPPSSSSSSPSNRSNNQMGPAVLPPLHHHLQMYHHHLPPHQPPTTSQPLPLPGQQQQQQQPAAQDNVLDARLISFD